MKKPSIALISSDVFWSNYMTTRLQQNFVVSIFTLEELFSSDPRKIDMQELIISHSDLMPMIRAFLSKNKYSASEEKIIDFSDIINDHDTERQHLN